VSAARGRKECSALWLGCSAHWACDFGGELGSLAFRPKERKRVKKENSFFIFRIQFSKLI
jgi:hypothetical protein